MDRLGALFLRVCVVSAGCSAVLAPLLLFSRRLREKIAARSFYIIFLFLALRLVLPVEIRLPAPAVTVPAPDFTVSVPVRETRPVVTAPSAKPSVQEPVVQTTPAVTPATGVRKVPALHILGAVWALGAAACAVYALGGYALARRRLLRCSVPAGEGETALLEDLRRELGVRPPVRLVRSEAAPSDLALGLFRPVIVLSEGEAPVDALVLRHELTHIRRRDVAYKAALSLACWVNWFNPLVWLMDQAAVRNIELCCDDDVARNLSDRERRRYGNLLLDAAAVHPVPFSTCFSGGKTQMKDRLLNLFTKKRNSAALVCLVLAAAILAGGLVAWEKAEATAPTGNPEMPQPSLSPENQEHRALLKDYFYANYTEENASVVLADLTGDGLDEMLVLTMQGMDDNPVNLRQPVKQFAYGVVNFFCVKDSAVYQFNSISDVANAHAGWGYMYLVPRPEGTGYALLDFRPYIGQGSASYTYAVYGLEYYLDGDDWLYLDGGGAFFSLDPVESMNPDDGDDATPEEAQAFLDRAQAYRNSGAALLAFYSDGEREEFSYLNASPADAFAGKLDHISALKAAVVTNGETAQFPLPPAGPASPEEALDRLEASVEAYPDGYVFRIPNYKGEWNVHISGRMRMDWASHPADTEEMFMSVHYLEDEQWKPGKRYSFETEGAYFSELTLTASVTTPDGASAERTILLAKNDAGPEEALDRLEASVEAHQDGYVFSIPSYAGDWKVHIDGRMRMDWASHPADTPEMFTSVRCGEWTVRVPEDEQGKPGKQYSYETDGREFSELTLTAQVTAPDGSSAEREIVLEKDGENVLSGAGNSPLKEVLAMAKVQTKVEVSINSMENGSLAALLAKAHSGRTDRAKAFKDIYAEIERDKVIALS